MYLEFPNSNLFESKYTCAFLYGERIGILLFVLSRRDSAVKTFQCENIKID